MAVEGFSVGVEAGDLVGKLRKARIFRWGRGRFRLPQQQRYDGEQKDCLKDQDRYQHFVFSSP